MWRCKIFGHKYKTKKTITHEDKHNKQWYGESRCVRCGHQGRVFLAGSHDPVIPCIMPGETVKLEVPIYLPKNEMEK